MSANVAAIALAPFPQRPIGCLGGGYGKINCVERFDPVPLENALGAMLLGDVADLGGRSRKWQMPIEFFLRVHNDDEPRRIRKIPQVGSLVRAHQIGQAVIDGQTTSLVFGDRP